jgi:dedicator of cytokinesis protein 1
VIIRQKDVSLIQKAKGIIVGLSQYDVESDSFYRITSQPTNKRGFPEVILPGMSRNDLFITLDSGEFPEGKTFEIGVSVRLDDGEVLPVCFFFCLPFLPFMFLLFAWFCSIFSQSHF